LVAAIEPKSHALWGNSLLALTIVKSFVLLLTAYSTTGRVFMQAGNIHPLAKKIFWSGRLTM